MAILGIRKLKYGVSDFEASTKFFEDFGLDICSKTPVLALFRVGNGAMVEVLPLEHRDLPLGQIEGDGVREVTWGVDSAESLGNLKANLGSDHEIEPLANGGFRFTPFFGVPMSFEQWSPARPAVAPDPVNAPGLVQRLNTHRKWRRRACPKAINHVVFRTAQYEEATLFMMNRLGFRLSDIQKGFGSYIRANGSNNHHNLLLLNANAALPVCDGVTRFDHANFGLEDIDELMIGVNNMIRKGWSESDIGLGRHRVDSGLFYYIPCPAGGEAEYGADADFVDDSWVPRNFYIPLFGYSQWTHNIPHFLEKEPEWAFSYLSEEEVRELSINSAGASSNV